MKRRLMVLFLSLSAATVFAAGQKEKNAAPCGGFFYFLQGARPCGAPGFPLQFAASRAFSCGKAARFAPRRLSRQSCPLCPAPPFRRPLISAPIPRAFGGSDGRLRIRRLLTQRFDFGRGGGLCGSAAFNAVFCAFSCNLCSRFGRRQTPVSQ